MSKVIFEDVASAARRLAETGERPSAPKIRRLLGDRGGMATIQKHLDSWRETEEAKELQEPNIPEMPEHLQGDAQTLIQQIWASATAMADKDIQNEREKLAMDRAEMEEKLLETIAVSEEQENQIDALQEQIKALEAKLSESHQESTEIHTQLASESKARAILKERCAQLESSLAAASDREDKNRLQYDAALKSAEEREAKLLAQIDKLADNIKSVSA